jgi:hypothetical protein
MMTFEEFVQEYNYMTGSNTEELDEETLQELTLMVDSMMKANVQMELYPIITLNKFGKIVIDT